MSLYHDVQGIELAFMRKPFAQRRGFGNYREFRPGSKRDYFQCYPKPLRQTTSPCRQDKALRETICARAWQGVADMSSRPYRP